MEMIVVMEMVEEVIMMANFLMVTTMANSLVVVNPLVNFTMTIVIFPLNHNPSQTLSIHRDRKLLVRFVVRMGILLWIVTMA